MPQHCSKVMRIIFEQTKAIIRRIDGIRLLNDELSPLVKPLESA